MQVAAGLPALLTDPLFQWTTILASYARAYDRAGVAAGLTNRIRMAVVSSPIRAHAATRRAQPLDEIVGALNHFPPTR